MLSVMEKSNEAADEVDMDGPTELNDMEVYCRSGPPEDVVRFDTVLLYLLNLTNVETLLPSCCCGCGCCCMDVFMSFFLPCTIMACRICFSHVTDERRVDNEMEGEQVEPEECSCIDASLECGRSV